MINGPVVLNCTADGLSYFGIAECMDRLLHNRVGTLLVQSLGSVRGTSPAALLRDPRRGAALRTGGSTAPHRPIRTEPAAAAARTGAGRTPLGSQYPPRP